MNRNYKDLIYLLHCAVNGITPDTARVCSMDSEQLYRLAKFHSVRAAVYIALKRTGVQNKTYDQAYKKAVRKNIYLDMERTAIIADFEQQGIWYMPLKGSVLKDLYPENGMREMSDNDILFDVEKQEQSRAIMLSHSYTVEHSTGKAIMMLITNLLCLILNCTQLCLVFYMLNRFTSIMLMQSVYSKKTKAIITAIIFQMKTSMCS